MPAEGGQAERVTADSGEERSAGWSPDGRSLVYYLTGRGLRDGLYVISRDDHGHWGPPRKVWIHPNGARWSRDGRTLLSTWTDGIWLIPAAGGAARQEYRLPDGVDGPEPADAQWSPDGRTIYVKAVDPRGVSSMWALSPGGGPPRPLVRFDDPAKPSYRTWFATDGRRFFFTVDDRQSDIYVAELRGLK
jgi:Tol biopolymer transport system component